jgi:glyoxylase-like metal-dependent hydrolase (beta-lactamase superfamily II)/rhodanese-related sulfurtransferase
VLFRQFLDADLGCASYLIGDESSAEAVLVDPAYAIEQYLDEAERLGVRFTRVLETHTHADHVSGHGQLALEHGLTIAIHPAADPEYPFEPLEGGAELAVGETRVRVLHTPGHRPEHCCFVAGDAVLTGDSLFVGSVARPDLAIEAHAGAEGLFHSLHRLLDLPDSYRVFPGHVAGSLCGSRMSSDPSSTIGRERTGNPALAISLVHEFVAEAAAVSTARPPNMSRIVELNRGPFIGAPPPLEPVRSANGATVLDVRPPEAYGRGHVHGALNVPVSGGSFAVRAGFLLRPDERVVLHASDPDEAERAARGLRSIGFLALGGYLAEPAATETMEAVALDELHRLLGRDSIELVDVRELDERDTGYIPGSVNIPYRLVRARAEQLPHDRPVVTICESGARAAIAASVLAAAGLDAHPVLDGGIPDWEKGGNGTVHFRRCGA